MLAFDCLIFALLRAQCLTVTPDWLFQHALVQTPTAVSPQLYDVYVYSYRPEFGRGLFEKSSAPPSYKSGTSQLAAHQVLARSLRTGFQSHAAGELSVLCIDAL